MARADYECDVCGRAEEHPVAADADGAPCGEWVKDDARCPGNIRRVWSSIHLGSMSSGEPPR